ncbi:hypothetical protein VW35_04365 [Devosia soli]|uniref:Uncharacterized protein n=1 Tax=Devosia soli TaxID=361041 RepID=A0A0F5LC36_9HYPH|nr:hypothetical protein [Devosia soli]KKB79749.1 hypothetical protein VW35_04365 [Devosia soli]
MFRTALLAVALLGTTIHAFAQDVPDYSGTYLGSGEGDLTLELNRIEDDRYGISIETVVPIENDMPGCAGGIDGEMLLSEGGGNFFVENEMYDPESDSPMFSERYCEIGIIFNEDGTVTTEERDGCLEYHGASCGFSGNLTHANAAG